MRRINYEGKVFQAMANVESGNVDKDTIFFYHQKDDYLWGNYEGGQIRAGVLIGRVHSDDSIEFDYWHFDKNGMLRGGHCISIPKVMQGQLHLYEKWHWTLGKDGQGSSIIVEIKQD